jgi:hypothetical protein
VVVVIFVEIPWKIDKNNINKVCIIYKDNEDYLYLYQVDDD